MLLVIDNYDSFTYNIVQYLGEMNVAMQIVAPGAWNLTALLSTLGSPAGSAFAPDCIVPVIGSRAQCDEPDGHVLRSSCGRDRLLDRFDRGVRLLPLVVDAHARRGVRAR